MLTEKLWVRIVIGVALFILIVIFIFAKALLVDRKIFTDYSKTLDYDKFEHDILRIINMPNLDRETVNFYKMQYAAIALSYSYDKYQEIIKEVFEPTNRAYLPSYYTLGINITMPYEEFIPAIEEAKRKCGAAYSKRIDSIKELWTAYYTGESNKDINLLAPRDEKKKSRDAMSLFVQIFYYLHNDDKHKAIELKNEFMAKYSRLNTLVDIIEKSFNHSEEEL